MDTKTTNCFFKLDEKSEQEVGLTPLEFDNKNIKIENRYSTIHIPVPKKPGELDLKIKTNLTLPVRRNCGFLQHWSAIISILCVLLVVGITKYRQSELDVFKERILSLSTQVDILKIQCEGLRNTILILQDRLDFVTSEHTIDERDIKLFDKDTSDDSVGKILNTSGAEDSTDQSLTNVGSGITEKIAIPSVNSSHMDETTVEIILNNSSRIQDLKVSDVVVSRIKRSSNKGNKKRPGVGHTGSPNKKRKNHGATLLHLLGARPEQNIEDAGLIAPWYPDDKAAGEFGFNKYNMARGDGAVEIKEAGLYYIYAQVYYLTTELQNSFVITLKQEGNHSPQNLSACSVNGPNSDKRKSDVTCFTSIVYYLNVNDRIYLQQLERNRLLLFKEGYSFLGIVQLNSMNEHVSLDKSKLEGNWEVDLTGR